MSEQMRVLPFEVLLDWILKEYETHRSIFGIHESVTNEYREYVQSFLTIAEKLAARSEEEVLVKEIIIRGVISIQSGDNPRIVEQKLKTFLPAGSARGRDRSRAEAA